MKHINEIIKTEKPLLSPRELTKQQLVKNTENRTKKRDSKNIPQPIKRKLKNGLSTYEDSISAGRVRFKMIIYFKDGNRRYFPSIDGYYKLKNGVKFWYIDEEKSFSKLVNLCRYKYYNKFKTATIYMNINDTPTMNQNAYNYLVYKNVYNTEYEFITNVDKQTGEIKKQPLYDFVTKELTRIAKGEMSNEHLLVNDFLIDLMSFKAYYNI